MVAILNAGIEAQISLKAPNAVGAVAVDVSGNVATITLTLEPAGVYLVRAWLADDTGGTLTDTLPDTSGVRQWDIITDSNGQYVFTVEHSGVQSWYCHWAVLAWVNANTTALEFT